MVFKHINTLRQNVKSQGGLRNFALNGIAKALMSDTRDDGSINTDIHGAFSNREGDGINPHLSQSKVISNFESYVLKIAFLGMVADLTNIITINVSEQQKMTIFGLLVFRILLIVMSTRNILSDGAIVLIYKYLKDNGPLIKDTRAKLPDIFPNADTVVPILVDMVLKLQKDNAELRKKLDDVLKKVYGGKKLRRRR